MKKLLFCLTGDVPRACECDVCAGFTNAPELTGVEGCHSRSIHWELNILESSQPEELGPFEVLRGKKCIKRIESNNTNRGNGNFLESQALPHCHSWVDVDL